MQVSDCLVSPNRQGSLLAVTLRCQGIAQGAIFVERSNVQHNWANNDVALLTSLADLFAQRLMHEQIRRDAAQHKALFEAADEGIIVFSNGCFFDVNPALCKMFGATKDELIGKSPIEFSPAIQPDGSDSAEKALSYIQACLQGAPQNFEWVHLKSDGTEFDADITLNAVSLEGENTLFSLLRDISDRKETQRKEEAVQEEIRYRATHDSLIGLMNREMVHKTIQTKIDLAKHESTPVNIALLLFDLNRFKEVNDTLGHATGDKVLQKVALDTVKHVSKADGQLFRLGGDEFIAVFCSDLSTLHFDELEEFVVQCLKRPIVVDDVNMEMGASIGIATYPKDGADSHELLRCADVAMYHSKENETASSWYKPENDFKTKRRLAMMVELGTAIREDQLTLHYQPRIHIQTGDVTGCEALLRWNHPTLGMVPPDDFIPLAEMSDLIHPLTAWVLKKAFHQLTNLRAKGDCVPIAINISARNLIDS